MVVVQFAPLVEMVRDSIKKANLELKTLLFSFLIYIFRKAFYLPYKVIPFLKTSKIFFRPFSIKTNNIAPD